MTPVQIRKVQAEKASRDLLPDHSTVHSLLLADHAANSRQTPSESKACAPSPTRTDKMWLINTSSLCLEYFAMPEKAPPYAILSHTWGEEELHFTEFQHLHQQGNKAREKRGFAKIERTCVLARGSAIAYAWVDTCCIDKSSSAELSESINSMYSYYRRAKICYVFIDDWWPDLEWDDLFSLEMAVPPPSNSDRSREGEWAPLRWFTRGWTLQELVAPKELQFYDATWSPRGFKYDPEVTHHLARITGIASGILLDGSETSLNSVCVGQRMSWAAHRETTREEDIAYCLMGIFQVNMPLLYGEGSRAFLRFQEEIIKKTTDLSLLAWTAARDQHTFAGVGIFAIHPRQFSGLKECVLVRSQFSQTSEITLTNKGLRFDTAPYLIPDGDPELSDIFLDTSCTSDKELRASYVIRLFRMSRDLFVRVDFEPDEIGPHRRRLIRGGRRVLYVPQHYTHAQFHPENVAVGVIGGCIDLEIKNAAPEFFQVRKPVVWPASHQGHSLSQDNILINVTDLPRFFGYIKVDIFHAQLGELTDEILAVYYGETSGITSVCLLWGNAAQAFIKLATDAEKQDPITAEKMLFDRIAELQALNSCSSHVDIGYTHRNTQIRVSTMIRPALLVKAEMFITLHEVDEGV